MDSDRVVLLCEAHHPGALGHLKLMSSKSDVWEKLAAVVHTGKVLRRDVLCLIYKQRPAFLQSELLGVVKMYGDVIKDCRSSVQDCNGNGDDNVSLHDEYLRSNSMWKNSGIPDAVANDCELFKVCCDTFFDLFIDCNFSRLLYVVMTGFYRRLLAVGAVDLLHYISPSFTLMVEELSIIENVNCNQVSKCLIKSLDEELRRLMTEKKSAPSLIAIFCAYPQSFFLLRDSQAFQYFFSQLRFHYSYHHKI